ncbi:Rpn family recombination-promoting nuclease/putative transposase [Candidatus Electrothrix sp.]|uniref:Rpn family recombination-promoting nuclease/putative transposase n=1 Tax=Candidatus Electrothrix sp. TaxID=2170559 RepID=UPI00405722B6
MASKERYINLFTDYGFKKIFGEEPNKNLLLDFVFDEDKDQPEKYRYDVKLTDIDTNRVFYDKLTFIYLEMPKFSKRLDELKTRFDKWLYVIRNLNRLERIPDMLREQVFEQLFDTAEIARFTPDQVRSYEKSLKYYRDMKNSLDTAFDEGRVEGKEEGKNERDREIVRNGIQQGIDIKMIAQLTGLSEEEIKEIEKERSDD